MKSPNSEFRNAIVRSIDVGEDKAVKLKDLIENRLSSHRKDTQSSFSSFKKNCYRIIQSIEGEGLSKIKIGNAHCYYWETQEDKDAAIDQFEMSEERAFAFSFIRKYLPELMPPHIYRSLKTEFDRANDALEDSKIAEYLGKIDFNPLGYELYSELDQDYASEKELQIWQFVFDCTFNEVCFSATYNSIHNSYDSTKLILSPQRIVLLNQQLKVLAYEHKTKTTRYFEVRKLSKVEKSKEKFVEIKTADHESREKFSAICHTWVKSYFESTSLARNATFTELDTKDCWLMETTLSFPIHFNRNEPDPFFIANYLSGFSDSLVVNKPEFLREEMQRRAASLAAAYSNKIAPEEVILTSPHVMARKDNH